MAHHQDTWPRRRSFAIIAIHGLFVFGILASAPAALVYDTFTGADNTALIGRMPAPDDTPATSYAGNGNVSLVGGPTGGTPYEADIQSNMARIGSDAGLGLNLNIGTATTFELAITFNISNNTENQTNNGHRGAGLGFFSSVALGSGGSSHGFNNFTGLAVDITGSVRLIIGGAASGTFTTVAGFNPALSHTLTYQVNTATGVGTISNIFLDGASVSLTAPVNTFTIARTAYAGFYNSSGNISGDLANFDNFWVDIVPEPSALVAVTTVVMLACVCDLRERFRIPPNARDSN